MPAETTVYIVDDDPAFAESLANLINSMGARTKTFTSADDYLQQFDSQAPGCLILDVRMQRTSGLALQEQLAKLPLSPPIIIMTGHAEVPTALRAMRMGAVDFLQKTFAENELYEAVQRALIQDARAREVVQIVSGAMRQRPRLSVAGERADHEARVRRAQHRLEVSPCGEVACLVLE